MSLLTSHNAGLATSIICGLAVIWVSSKLLDSRRRHALYTQLTGPPSSSLLFGVTKRISDMHETGEFSEDAGGLYEQWAEEYGPVYRIPAAFGYEKIVLCDPKAIQHFYSRVTTGYLHTKMMKTAIANLVRLSALLKLLPLIAAYPVGPWRSLGRRRYSQTVCIGKVELTCYISDSIVDKGRLYLLRSVTRQSGG